MPLSNATALVLSYLNSLINGYNDVQFIFITTENKNSSPNDNIKVEENLLIIKDISHIYKVWLTNLILFPLPTHMLQREQCWKCISQLFHQKAQQLVNICFENCRTIDRIILNLQSNKRLKWIKLVEWIRRNAILLNGGSLLQFMQYLVCFACTRYTHAHFTWCLCSNNQQ